MSIPGSKILNKYVARHDKTLSNIKEINFYFHAKLTDFAMFSYWFNIWLTYCPMYRDYETHEYLLLHILFLLW